MDIRSIRFRPTTPPRTARASTRAFARTLVVATCTTLAMLAAAVITTSADAAPRDTSGGVRMKLGPLFNPETTRASVARHALRRWGAAESAVVRWNDVAIDTTGIDHTPVAPGETRVFGEQLGPGRSARAMAIVHIAMFDSVNAIVGGHLGYTDVPRVTALTSIEAAVAQAAHDTLVALYPSQQASLDALLAEDLSRVRAQRPAMREAGIDLGRRAAAAILASARATAPKARAAHGRQTTCRAICRAMWRQDPISQSPLALGANWGGLKPFVLARDSSSACPRRRPWTVPSTRRPTTRSGAWEATASPRRPCAPPPDADRRSSGPTTARRACARRPGCTTRSR